MNRRFSTGAALLGVAALAGAAGAAGAQEPGAIELDTLRVDVASRASSLVTATRAVEVLDRDALDRAPARTVAEALTRLLGADVLARSTAQADVALRGSTAEQVLVLVDGVRMNDPQTGHFHLDLAIPLEEVERIEVLRGGGSSVHGADAMGGVIHILTRGAGAGVEARAEAGSFGTRRVSMSAGGSTAALRSRVAAELHRSDGHRPGTDARTLTGRGTLESPLAGGALRADVGLARRDFGARHFYTAPDAPFDEYERTRTATASLGWRSAPGRWSLEPRLTARRHSDEFLLERDDPAFYRNVHTSWRRGGELLARVRASTGLSLALGGEAYRETLESTNLGDPAGTRTALFGELAAGRDGVAIAHLGLRGDHHSAYGGFLAPSVAVAAWATDRIRFRAAAGRSFRAPNWTERFYQDPANEGDPDLVPETAWTMEAGADASTPDRSAALGLSVFRRDARDLIDWARPAGDGAAVWQAMNVGRAVFTGLELDGRLVDPAGTRWGLQASLLRLSSQGDARESKYALRPLTRAVSVSAARPVLGLEVALRGYHARRVDETPTTTADARLSARLGGGLRAWIDLTNLLDARIRDVAGLPAPGRAVHVGAAWRR